VVARRVSGLVAGIGVADPRRESLSVSGGADPRRESLSVSGAADLRRESLSVAGAGMAGLRAGEFLPSLSNFPESAASLGNLSGLSAAARAYPGTGCSPTLCSLPVSSVTLGNLSGDTEAARAYPGTGCFPHLPSPRCESAEPLGDLSVGTTAARVSPVVLDARGSRA